MPNSITSVSPQVQMTGLRNVPKYDPFMGLREYVAMQRAMLAAARARGGGRGSSAVNPQEGDLRYGAWHYLPDGNKVWIIGKTVTDRKAGVEAANRKYINDVLNADPDYKKNIEGLSQLSIPGQKKKIANLRALAPRLAPKLGLSEVDTVKLLTADASKNLAARETEVNKAPGEFFGSLARGAMDLWDSFASIADTSAEKLARAKAANAREREAREENAFLDEIHRLEQEGRSSAGMRYSPRGLRNLLGESLSSLGAIVAAQGGGAAGGAAAGTALGGPVGGLAGAIVGGAAGGAATGGPMGSFQFARSIADEAISDTDKIRMLEDNNAGLYGALAGGAFGAIPGGPLALAGKGLARVPGSIGQRAAAFQIPAATAPRAIGRGIVQNAVDAAAMGAGFTVAQNQAYREATGQDIPLTAGLGDAVASGMILGLPFGLARGWGARGRYLDWRLQQPGETIPWGPDVSYSPWNSPVHPVDAVTLRAGNFDPGAPARAAVHPIDAVTLRAGNFDPGVPSGAVPPLGSFGPRVAPTPDPTVQAAGSFGPALNYGRLRRPAPIDSTLARAVIEAQFGARQPSVAVPFNPYGLLARPAARDRNLARALIEAQFGPRQPQRQAPSAEMINRYQRGDTSGMSAEDIAQIETILTELNQQPVVNQNAAPIPMPAAPSTPIPMPAAAPAPTSRTAKTPAAKSPVASAASKKALETALGKIDDPATLRAELDALSAKNWKRKYIETRIGELENGKPAASTDSSLFGKTPRLGPTGGEGEGGADSADIIVDRPTAATPETVAPTVADSVSGKTGGGNPADQGRGPDGTGPQNPRKATEDETTLIKPGDDGTETANRESGPEPTTPASAAAGEGAGGAELEKRPGAGGAGDESAVSPEQPKPLDRPPVNEQEVEQVATLRENNAGTPEDIRVQPTDTVEVARSKVQQQLENGRRLDTAEAEAEIVTRLSSTLSDAYNGVQTPAQILNRVNFSFHEPTAEQITKAVDRSFEQEAWHGTPNEIIGDLSTDHIGSGEGAQVHGWGLYVALTEATARDRYQHRLSRNRRRSTDLADDLLYKGENPRKHSDIPAIKDLLALYDDPDIAGFRTAREILNDFIRGYERRIRLYRKALADPLAYDLRYIGDPSIKLRQASDGLIVLRQIEDKPIYRGERLRLEIPDDDVMLREDVPLNKQPIFVQRQLQQLLKENNIPYSGRVSKVPGSSPIRLEDLKTGLLQLLHNRANYNKKSMQQAITDLLKRSGGTASTKVYSRSNRAISASDLASSFIRAKDTDIAAIQSKISGLSANKPYSTAYWAAQAPTKHGAPITEVTPDSYGRQIYHFIASHYGKDIHSTSKQASQLLDKYGIKGIRYNGHLDGECAVLFDGKYAKILERFFDQQGRGRIDFLNDGTARILFTDAADASTAMHEFQHFYLYEAGRLLHDPTVTDSAVKQLLTKDIETLGRWAGEKDNLTDPRMWSVETHEKTAKAFEQYFREGKAPTPELQTLFQKMKNLLVQLYKKAKDILGLSRLPKEIREVFGRELTGYKTEEAGIPGVDTARPVLRSMSAVRDRLDFVDKDILTKLMKDKNVFTAEDKAERLIARKALGEKLKPAEETQYKALLKAMDYDAVELPPGELTNIRKQYDTAKSQGLDVSEAELATKNTTKSQKKVHENPECGV